MYNEIMKSTDWCYFVLLLGFAGGAIGGFMLFDCGGLFGGAIAGAAFISIFCNPAMEAQALELAQLPYQQEKAAIIAEATNIECSLYRDADGAYFFLHEFTISEKDFHENGPKFIRVDIPDEKADHIMTEMTLLDETHDCNIHYDFTPFEEEVRTQFLAEHPEMADDYEEKLLKALVGDAKHICGQLYEEDGQYFLVDESLTNRNYITEDAARNIQQQMSPYLVSANQ